MKDINTTQHHSEHHIQTAITIGDQPGQVIGFVTPIHVSIPQISFLHITLMEITNKQHKVPGKQFLRPLSIIHHDRAHSNTGSFNINRTFNGTKKQI